MIATEEEIREYILMLYMWLDLDWKGYLQLRQLEKKCLSEGKIIYELR